MNETIKKWLDHYGLGWVIGLVLLIPLAANFVSPSVEEWGMSRYVFLARKLWPEVTVLIVICACFVVWRTSKQGILVTGRQVVDLVFFRRYGTVMSSLAWLIVFGAVVGCGWNGYHYLRARYAYVVKGAVQQEFRNMQLERATGYEGTFEFGRAIEIYKAIISTNPSGVANGSLEDRISLLKGLLEHATFLQKLEREEELRGDVRAAFRLLTERVRINPWDIEAEAKLSLKIQAVRQSAVAVEKLDVVCRSGLEPSMDDNLELLRFVFEPAVLNKIVVGKKSVDAKAVCGIFGRFTDSAAVRQLTEMSWQLGRASEIASLSQRLRGGEYVRKKVVRLELPSLVLPSIPVISTE